MFFFTWKQYFSFCALAPHRTHNKYKMKLTGKIDDQCCVVWYWCGGYPNETTARRPSKKQELKRKKKKQRKINLIFKCKAAQELKSLERRGACGTRWYSKTSISLIKFCVHDDCVCPSQYEAFDFEQFRTRGTHILVLCEMTEYKETLSQKPELPIRMDISAKYRDINLPLIIWIPVVTVWIQIFCITNVP